MHRSSSLALIALIGAASLAGAAAQPAFLTGPQEGAPDALAMAYLMAHAADYGLDGADLADLEVTDLYQTRRTGMTHLYLRQRYQGIPVYNGQIGINVARDGSIINLNSLAIGGLAAKVNAVAPTLAPDAAVRAAGAHFGLSPSEGLIQVDALGGPTGQVTFEDSGLSLDPIPASLMYQPTEIGVRLAWRTVLRVPGGSDWWDVRVDAQTGHVLDQNNWTSHAQAPTTKATLGGPCYDVIPVPAADPNDTAMAQVTVCDPADATASPFGWHDTNGVVGAEFTATQGNNVSAQEDQDANNSGGLRPDGGANLLFEFPWTPADAPTTAANVSASTVNLFYYNNIMHDITYQYGFDEPAGNFQANNYGNGGLGGDAVQADALDGSGTNNANFGTPADGLAPRMQMFRWTYPFPNELEITAPGGIAGTYQASSAAFGPALTTTGITGNIVLAADGAGLDVNDGCEPLTNGAAIAGNIALLNRGNCNFTVKVKNAQLVGATGALIRKITGGGPSTLGGTDATITIPSGMVSMATGDLIIGAGGATGTFRALAVQPEPDRDSDFDNGVIAHEYGHGISNRLVGGPAATGCLFGAEQMGEGLSDFWTVVLSPMAGDDERTDRGVGTYLVFEDREGLGIRSFPYSVDMDTNPQTYADIGTAAQPHGVGSIWMSMAYEVYQELIARYGLDMDLYNGTGGNNLMIQLVIDGMKLVGCGPTFVTLRDAILLADVNLTAGANQCEIWRGFAKRGVGVGAVSGGTGVGTEVESFAIPPTCSPIPNWALFGDGFESGDTSAWSSAVP